MAGYLFVLCFVSTEDMGQAHMQGYGHPSLSKIPKEH
jgi:hypothetical protein